ncbi:MAG TPA: PVC-type heme-binding CxxCH protein, partial [Pirellulales bacterium]|nr:PVC-type heme-binding CxxCH protein [Pirellulales bacterium]
RPGAAPVTMSRNDFSIDPVTGAFDLLSGGARFGGTFDDWGNRFLCNIRNPAQHIVLPSRYLARNRSLAAPSPIADMAESGDQLPVYSISPPEPWRVIRAQRWAGERNMAMPRSELVGAGVVTSASGITSYRGAAYPPKYHGNVFIAECAANLFYRLQLKPDGVTFKASRVDGKAEMVASTDNWFRPVNFVNAPDGTLHVLDMYRENIEHPWSIPEDIHAAVDLEAGRDMGRLWRLTPPGFKPGKPPRLGAASSAELVATLENPNGWWRETAQRLLFERQDRSIVPALRELVKHGRTPLARLHALWTLEGLESLDNDDVRIGLHDTTAGVRENALRLAEPRLGNAAILDSALRLALDDDARVRFQAAFTLGESNDPRVIDALAAIARRDAADVWTRTAVLSSVAETGAELLTRLLADATFIAEPASVDMIRDLAQFLGARGKQEEMQRVVAAVGSIGTDHRALSVVVTGIGQGLKRSGKSLRRAGFTGPANDVVGGVLSGAAKTATDDQQTLDARLAAIRLLAFDDFESVRTRLTHLMATSQPQEVQRAAVAVLGSFTAAETVELLLANWRTQTPAVRSEVISAMLGVRSRAMPLLKAIESGLIPASQIPFDQRRLLTRSSTPAVKELATRLFSADAPGPRKDVIERYKPALALAGDPTRGRQVFEKGCMNCHRAGDVGTKDTGPNLATIRAWNPEQVLINILDPNREVAPNFLSYTVVTTDGRVIIGIVVEDGVTGFTLKRADGTTETVLRRDIDEIAGSGISLMPEGVENTVSPENMADLIAFLLAPPPAASR